MQIDKFMKKFFRYFSVLITVLNPLLATDASTIPTEADSQKKPIMKSQLSNDEMLNLLITGSPLQQFNAVFAARFSKLRQKVCAELLQLEVGTQQNFTKLSLPLQLDIALFTAKTKFVKLYIDGEKMLRSLIRDEEEMKQYLLSTNK